LKCQGNGFVEFFEFVEFIELEKVKGKRHPGEICFTYHFMNFTGRAGRKAGKPGGWDAGKRGGRKPWERRIETVKGRCGETEGPGKKVC
jgi:hypothetical protein